MKYPHRLPVLILTLFLLLMVGGSGASLQTAAAQAQTAGIPVSEAAPGLEGRTTAITPDPLIQEMIDQVDSEAVSTYDRQLAGELPVWVDGDWYTISTRYTYSSVPIQKATHFVGQQMDQWGLGVEYHQWNATTNPNVIGELPGMNQPEHIVIIGAHLDAVQGAPGADDNASGSVATLLAAEILSQYHWDCTLRFAFWTGEEQGMLGSDIYAQRSSQLGEDIVGYLNLDMIAYNTTGSPRGIDVIYNPNMAATHDLALLFSDVVSAYNIDLIPDLRSSLGGGSDHQSFWDYGYTTILSIEDQSDFNPNYHSPGDTPANTDLSYFTDFVKASIGTFAHMGCLLPTSSNLVGTVSNVGGTPIPGAHIQAQLSPSQQWETQTGPDGDYELGLIGGIYTVTAQATGYMNFLTTAIVLTEGYTTTLDINLLVSPTYTLTGTVREDVSGEPLSAVVSVVGGPITPTHTDPATGQYSLTLMQGNYTLQAENPYHHAQTVKVNLQGNQQQDFDLSSICLLVVGDDYQYSSYYTHSLDWVGTDYLLTSQPPDLAALSFFQGAVWLTGDQVTATLTQSDQSTLAAYLDGGGRLFVSGQNIGQDIGASSFYGDYLHASFMAPDAGTNVLNGLGYLDPLVDILIQGGQGAGNQTSPDAISPANNGEAVYRYWVVSMPEIPQYGGVAFTGIHRTVYFSFGFEAIDRALDRDQVLESTLDYLGMCTPPNAPQAGFTTAWGSGSGEIQFTNTSHGSPLMNYTWDFGDGSLTSVQANPGNFYAQPGFYTVTLTVTNRYGQDTTSAVVLVPYEVYLPMMKK